VVSGYFSGELGSLSDVHNIALWDGSEWSKLGSGLNDYASAATVYKDNLVVAGGMFYTAGGKQSDGIAMWTKPGGCCGMYTGGYTGNCNCDAEGKRNLADITQLITRVYLTPKVPLCCEDNGNTNGDPQGTLNLSDITRLVDFVYISHAETAACP
jgi:hypothetical protein